MNLQAMWDWIWAERGWFFPAVVAVVIAVVGGVIALVRKLPSLDVDAVVQRLADQATQLGAAEQREKDRSTIEDRESTIRELTAMVESLEQQRRQPDAPPGIDAALEQLEQGETGAAESIFREILDAKKVEGLTANKEAAAAARHLGALYYIHDTQKAVSAYEEAVALDPDNPDGWNPLGLLRHRLGYLEAAVEAFERAQRLGNLVKDKGVIAVALGNLGVIYRTLGDLEKAEQYHLKSLKLEEELGCKEGMAHEYGNLGVIYATRGDLERAEEYLKKSLAINEELGRKEGMANAYCNLGGIYWTRGDLEKAEEYQLKSLELENELGRKEGMASTYGNLGLIYRGRGDLEKAEEYLLKSLALDEELGRKEGMANQYGNLGVVYSIRGDLERAEEYHLKSLEIEKELSRKQGMANQYSNLGQLAHDKGDKATACEHWAKARRLFAEVGIQDKVALMETAMSAAGCPMEEDAGTENLCD